ncbi:MAG: hypothetical protein HC930_04895 [Hydrococcus sp. SU_1_0]|nr:hypothetical protein [Hydrococcus sp. SU_1_0]NJO97717.1 hypothetical protein [Pleurocapsa sp. CRU_1_2]
MSEPTSTLADLIKECKHPLKVSFIFAPLEQIFTLAVGYEGVFPTIARYDKMPEDLNLAVLRLLPEFDVKVKNSQVTKQNLKDNGKRKVKSIELEKTIKSNNKTKKVKFAKSLI